MKNKIFRVSIAQYCKPITVFAQTEDQAILKAQEQSAWEVYDAEFQAEEISHDQHTR
jgi:hypothetical protein